MGCVSRHLRTNEQTLARVRLSPRRVVALPARPGPTLPPAPGKSEARAESAHRGRERELRGEAGRAFKAQHGAGVVLQNLVAQAFRPVPPALSSTHLRKRLTNCGGGGRCEASRQANPGKPGCRAAGRSPLPGTRIEWPVYT